MKPTKKSKVLTLLDGRSFWTTGNGFNKYMASQKGVTIPITSSYYTKLIRLWRKENSKKFQRNLTQN